MSLAPRTRSRSGTVWYVHLNPDGTADVAKRGRTVGTDMTPAQAKAYLRRNLRKGDRGYQVEPDGYRTPL